MCWLVKQFDNCQRCKCFHAINKVVVTLLTRSSTCKSNHFPQLVRVTLSIHHGSIVSRAQDQRCLVSAMNSLSYPRLGNYPGIGPMPSTSAGLHLFTLLSIFKYFLWPFYILSDFSKQRTQFPDFPVLTQPGTLRNIVAQKSPVPSINFFLFSIYRCTNTMVTMTSKASIMKTRIMMVQSK